MGRLRVGARVAVSNGANAAVKYGFIVSVDNNQPVAHVRFFTPVGYQDAEVAADKIAGIVGETFFASRPIRPEPCERVIFFDDSGRQRKGWVWDVEEDGLVVLLVGDAPSDKNSENGTSDNVFVERWLEEIVLLDVGEAFRKLSTKELEELEERGLVAGPAACEGQQSVHGDVEHEAEHDVEQKGGFSGAESLVAEAMRGADELRDLMAQINKLKPQR